MKTLKLLFLLSCLTLASRAQKIIRSNVDLNEQTIVKDSTGKILPYNYWKEQLASGNYSVRQTITHVKDGRTNKVKKDTTAFVLTWLDEAGRKRLAEYKKSFASQQSETAQEQQATTSNTVLKAEEPYRYVPTRLPRTSEGFVNGEPMEPFKESTIDGKKIDIKALKGKIVVLNFWFINCPACRDEMPELNKVVAEYSADPNIIFVGLSLDKRWEIKDFLKKMPFDFQHIADARYYGDKYKVNLYPTTVVIDKEGIIRFNSVGSDNTGYWIKKTIEDIKAQNM
ncbi:TlpA family protein disulfide reductase [Mucilaginibacter achroorhodeus]|uniref:TlpA family protein disulfide reductase n=1 Tax=Mucilaginibacter achroorhodeus TaxID=2599294 RepID=A0A563U076_9SPHI|nr:MULTISPECIES: TlpA disulfide reductase family protein [Mucilaginibacter]QXV65518.1 TlpA family protein disulfide reductase [Mucilaginibacter sp. 21P]TWR25045.1 TlpA family protein disulfide reductase [Mucilaginibacter achroorhodeus]